MSAIGDEIAITTMNPNQVQIMAKAQFKPTCCKLGPRTYFHVLENSIESNFPLYGCTMIPTCCDIPDMVSKTYFDRGIWNAFCCLRCIGCINGKPTFYGHNPKHVICCMDCCDCYNDFVACNFPGMCGDRIHYTPYDSACCGLCGAKANWCSNCCGMCGRKNGEPLFSLVMIEGLMPGSGEQLVTALDHARASWSSRTGKP